MESNQDRSSAPNMHRGPSPNADVSENGKLRRIASHTQGLVGDLREWIDLRLDLALLEMEERVDELRNEMALGLVSALIGFFAALFVLTTVALGVGWLLGHSFWGFLIVSGLLLGGLGILRAAQPALLPSSDLYQSVRGEGHTEKYREDGPADRASETAAGGSTAESATT